MDNDITIAHVLEYRDQPLLRESLVTVEFFVTGKTIRELRTKAYAHLAAFCETSEPKIYSENWGKVTRDDLGRTSTPGYEQTWSFDIVTDAPPVQEVRNKEARDEEEARREKEWQERYSQRRQVL